MVFTTPEFIVFFAAVFVAYWALPSRGRWGLLLAASWLFYAWASPYYLIFLGVTTVVTYLAAVGMDTKRISRKWGGVGAAVVTIGMLVVFKYLEFLFANVNWLMGAVGVHASLPAVKLLLPIGLSFYVFQSLGYCIDVQREIVSAERNFFKHALFVSYFPQILQGPIGDYGRLAPQLFEAKTFNYEQAVFGIQRVAWGFFKKVMVANIIADRINPVWSAVGDYPGLICWSAILVLYAIQLYADFSGYMDIACGCSQMLGVRLDENFQCPYFAKSVADFWRRWHITLGAWFKNYVFYPLLRGGLLSALRGLVPDRPLARRGLVVCRVRTLPRGVHHPRGRARAGHGQVPRPLSGARQQQGLRRLPDGAYLRDRHDGLRDFQACRPRDDG